MKLVPKENEKYLIASEFTKEAVKILGGVLKADVKIQTVDLCDYIQVESNTRNDSLFVQVGIEGKQGLGSIEAEFFYGTVYHQASMYYTYPQLRRQGLESLISKVMSGLNLTGHKYESDLKFSLMSLLSLAGIGVLGYNFNGVLSQVKNFLTLEELQLKSLTNLQKFWVKTYIERLGLNLVVESAEIEEYVTKSRNIVSAIHSKSLLQGKGTLAKVVDIFSDLAPIIEKLLEEDQNQENQDQEDQNQENQDQEDQDQDQEDQDQEEQHQKQEIQEIFNVFQEVRSFEHDKNVMNVHESYIKKELRDLEKSIEDKGGHYIEGELLVNYDEVKQKNKGSIIRLNKKLTSILKDNQTDRWGGNNLSGKLNNKKLFKFKTKTQRIFQKKICKKNKNYNVTILVDLSGSMSNVAREVLDSVVILLEALEIKGVSTSIIGFNSKIFRWKAFDEKITSAVKLKVSGIVGEIDSLRACDTLDHAALLTCSDLIKTDPETNLVFAISDGESGQTSNKVKDLLLGDLKKQISKRVLNQSALNLTTKKEDKKMLKRGVHVYGVGVGGYLLNDAYRNKIINTDINKLYLDISKVLRKHVKRV